MLPRVLLGIGLFVVVVGVASVSGIILADRHTSKRHLAPVTPIATLPGPKTPELTEEEIARAKQIFANDPRVATLLGGEYVIESIGSWLWEDHRKLGAFMTVTLASPANVEAEWPFVQHEPDGTYKEMTWRVKVRGLRTVYASVDLQRGKVVYIQPARYIEEIRLETPPVAPATPPAH